MEEFKLQAQAYWNADKVVNQFSSAKAADYISHFFSAFDEKADLKVLDIGCGGGRNTVLLHNMGFEVYGCDSSPGMVYETQRQLSLISPALNTEEKVVLGEAYHLPYLDNTFDFILSNGVFHNVLSQDDFNACLMECSRLLKHNGVLYLSLFTSDYLDPGLLQVPGLDNIFQTPDGLGMILFNAEAIERMLDNHGFKAKGNKECYVIEVETGKRSLFRNHYAVVKNDE
ncbi:class I SAM-dependent methyltransferase [Paenibacillus sp. FSL R7-0331]|uniref:class I SAM-dependent methyltransferase n=1 Tax=Paenibacillus sp. FSL R7-0331 TaxID=1536773 RepID=UPI0018CF298C|nr:class I SAM-dependent methyltransferase [Paenibacillus sp. FSL R7-0331]